MTSRASLVIVCLLAAHLAACGRSNDLLGSLGEVYRLDHDFVRARLYDSELSIEYVKNDGAVPVHVTVRTDANPSEGGTYALGGAGSEGTVTGALSDGTLMPDCTGGELRLDEYGATRGARIEGDFEARFVTPRDTLQLTGSFETDVEIIDWPAQPEPPDGP